MRPPPNRDGSVAVIVHDACRAAADGRGDHDVLTILHRPDALVVGDYLRLDDGTAAEVVRITYDLPLHSPRGPSRIQSVHVRP